MTQIMPTVDVDQEGKQVGWLRLPHSVTRSAYGTLSIPIAVIRNGAGPQILLVSGNHGGEYEGQIVLTRMPLGPQSAASARVIASTAPFVPA